MRVKDEEKQAALFEAAVKVVNKVGFASSSVAKIAKEAGVSAATLYTYHKSKDDLMVSTYVDIKRQLSRMAVEDIDEDMPIRDSLKQVWANLFRFAVNHPAYGMFAEQFSNSPYNNRVDQGDIDRLFSPLIKIILRGMERKIIKNVNVDIINSFVLYPVSILANPRLSRNFDPTSDEQVDLAFQLAWDAIKL